MPAKEALYWKKEDNNVICSLCPHNCKINDEEFGFCNARQNINGKLIAESYGRVSALNIDPIEKKPLYHFYPGLKTLSFGSFGCNLKCAFCQNYSISTLKPRKDVFFSPEDASYFAFEKNIKLISYTYNEPLINYEWVLDMSMTARKKGMQNILVTNGYINEEPLKKLSDFIDAANIDLKAFSNSFYRKNCKGSLEPVLNSIKILKKAGVHIEITNLLIDEYNTDIDEFQKMLDFIVDLSDKIPLHLSRYFPSYQFSARQTKEETLIKFYDMAKEKLNNVYLGNFNNSKYESTYCKNCGFCIIERNGYDININCENLKFCCNCGTKNNIII